MKTLGKLFVAILFIGFASSALVGRKGEASAPPAKPVVVADLKPLEAEVAKFNKRAKAHRIPVRAELLSSNDARSVWVQVEVSPQLSDGDIKDVHRMAVSAVTVAAAKQGLKPGDFDVFGKAVMVRPGDLRPVTVSRSSFNPFSGTIEVGEVER